MRVPASTAVTSQVVVVVPAWVGSSETKSTAGTTRTPGTTSTKSFDDVRICGGLPACTRDVRVGQHEPVRPGVIT